MARQKQRQQTTVEVETAPPQTSLLDVIVETPVAPPAPKIRVEFEARLEILCCGDWQVQGRVRGAGYIQNGKLHLDLPVDSNELISPDRRITIVCY